KVDGAYTRSVRRRHPGKAKRRPGVQAYNLQRQEPRPIQDAGSPINEPESVISNSSTGLRLLPTFGTPPHLPPPPHLPTALPYRTSLPHLPTAPTHRTNRAYRSHRAFLPHQ